MTELFTIEADLREKSGKSAARALRLAGKIPANIYGRGEESKLIAVDNKTITTRYLKGRFKTQICEITFGKEKIKAVPKDIAFHPVTDQIEHIDFYSLKDGQEITIKIPLTFINSSKSLGIKRGGSLNVSQRSIALVCAPEKIPSNIEIDLEKLKIGDSIHQSDITLPDGCRLAVTQENLAILAITGRSTGESEEGEEGDSEAKEA